MVILFVFYPPRIRTAEAVLPLLFTVAFIVRGNVSLFFGQRPLSGRCYSVTPVRPCSWAGKMG